MGKNISYVHEQRHFIHKHNHALCKDSEMLKNDNFINEKMIFIIYEPGCEKNGFSHMDIK